MESVGLLPGRITVAPEDVFVDSATADELTTTDGAATFPAGRPDSPSDRNTVNTTTPTTATATTATPMRMMRRRPVDGFDEVCIGSH